VLLVSLTCDGLRKVSSACNLQNEMGHIFVNSSHSKVSATGISLGTMHAFVED
jgi:hypothetical protein